MRIIDSLKKLYGSNCITQESIGECKVCERNENSKFVKLFIKNGQHTFFEIAEDLYVKSLNINNKYSILNNQNCDGVFITEIDNKAACVFSELKSSLDSNDIFKAHKQIIFSFFKIYLFLSLSEEFNNNVEYIGIIGSRPVKDKSQEALFELELLNMQEGRPVDKEMICLVELWKEKTIKHRIRDFSFIKGFPLCGTIGDKEMTICLYTAKSFMDDSGSFDLSTME